MQALRRLRIPEYLTRIVDRYLGERVLLFDTSDGPKEAFVLVPQGSVLGLLLWNTMYDGVLRLPMPANVHVTGFADHVAITIVPKTIAEVEDTANTAARKVESWLSLVGLQLAAHKTEAVLIDSQADGRRGWHSLSKSHKIPRPHDRHQAVLQRAPRVRQQKGRSDRQIARADSPEHKGPKAGTEETHSERRHAPNTLCRPGMA